MSAYPWYDDTGEDWPFCECGVTLLDDEDEFCSTCAAAPHHRDCPCDECELYWSRIADESRRAADRANRALVCSCGWTGAFIEHHNSQAYGAVAQVGCKVAYRDPANERERSVLTWDGAAWLDELALSEAPAEPLDPSSRGRNER